VSWLRKKADPPELHHWQYSPYEFEPGKKVVIEIAASEIKHIEDLHKLKLWFKDNGINAHVILTKTGHGIKPVTVKRMTEGV
jgi:hypothetical protein